MSYSIRVFDWVFITIIQVDYNYKQKEERGAVIPVRKRNTHRNQSDKEEQETQVLCGLHEVLR